MGNRSRLVYSGDTITGLGQSIAIADILPFNATLIQVSVYWAGAPTTPSPISIYRSTSTPQFPVLNFLLKEFDPTVFPDAEIVCVESFEFRRNDTVIAAYANLDDIDSAVELIFKESD